MMKRSTFPRLGVHCSTALVSVTLTTCRCVGGAGTAVKRQNIVCLLLFSNVKTKKVAVYKNEASLTVYPW